MTENKDIIHRGRGNYTVAFDAGIGGVVKKNAGVCEIKHRM
jgi:hypothetical protein